MIVAQNAIGRHFCLRKAVDNFPKEYLNKKIKSCRSRRDRFWCAAFDKATAESGKRRRKKSKGEKWEGLESEDLWRGPNDPFTQPRVDPHPLLGIVLEGAMQRYFEQTPHAQKFMKWIFEDNFRLSNMTFDYLEFRTLEYKGMSVDVFGSFFESFGYKEQSRADVEENKFFYRWFLPPPDQFLPKILVISTAVDGLSDENRDNVIKRLGDWPEFVEKNISAVIGRGCPWTPPTLKEYQMLEQENSVAAWVLVHGYTLSGVSVFVNGMLNPLYKFGKVPEPIQLEEVLNAAIKDNKFMFNPADGEYIKVNEDSTARYFATLADIMEYPFGDGQQFAVPGSYIGCVERKLKPEFAKEESAGVRDWQFHETIDKKMVRDMMVSIDAALPMVAEQMEIDEEVKKRARRDGNPITGKGGPYEEELVEKYYKEIYEERGSFVFKEPKGRELEMEVEVEAE